ncbi:MAG: DUF2313 domain-containing protein [Bacillota bacterium]|nr:DUF2313 domain-containing protein [Bacillota bacterium]
MSLSESTREILAMLPTAFSESPRFQALLDVIGSTLEAVRVDQANRQLQRFVSTATGDGLARWEKDFGLPVLVDKSDAERRSRILAKLRGPGHLNAALIQNVAEAWVYGTVEVTQQPEQYTITIKFVDPRGVPSTLDDVEAAIEEIKPAHLAVVYQFTFTVVGDLITWGTTCSDLVTQGVTVDALRTWKPA